MKAPRRLIEERPSPELARALRAGIEIAPPRGAEDAVWTALHTALAASAVSATAGAAAAGAKSATGATGLVTVFKSAVIGLAAGAVVVGGHAALSASSATAPDAAPVPASIATQTPVAPSEPLEPAGVHVPAPESPPAPAARKLAALPSASARPSPSPITSAATGRAEPPRPDESAAVLEARKELRSGDATRALEVLEQSAARFPDGSLAQERSALEIEALVIAGKRDEAKRKTAAFLAQYPDSPHAARLRGLVR